ncbi:hypothetical protein, partial [Serratia marcescens]|uniref:hypothetical protein n=1 Tax=Serratia marcescens TaxID=615 RepID=UPI0016491327
DKRDLLAKNLLGLKIKKYRAGKTQKRNDYPRRNLHSIISRNKNPRQHTEANINQTLTAVTPPYRKLLPPNNGTKRLC